LGLTSLLHVNLVSVDQNGGLNRSVRQDRLGEYLTENGVCLRHPPRSRMLSAV
jgi:hypothetical protein